MVQRESDQPDDDETPAGREDTDRTPQAADSGALARTVRLVASDYLLTVNPLDGSEIEPCPPGDRPGPPARRSADDRPAPASAPVLLERDDERERLTRLLSRGRSVRLTGPHGSGRSALLDAVAAGITTAAPDGVIRLSGHRHTPTDLLHALFAAVHDAPLHRPSPALLRESLATVGAVVLIDDVDFGGTALDDLLEATPECAYLFASLPDAVPPSPEHHVEDVTLSGLSRTGCLELLERSTDRALTDEEADWAADLWLGCSGHARTIVLGGTLLRQRDTYGPVTRPGLPSLTRAGLGTDAGPTAVSDRLIPRIVESLGDGARAVLRMAVALGGPVPHSSHLPALTDDAHVDETLAELRDSGLLTGSGHHRLADGVAPALIAAGLGDEDGECAESAAQHYVWWTGHPSVTGERIREQSDVVLAAVHSAQRSGHPAAAVLLARTAAPLLAAGTRWGVWERVLRTGQESARQSGDVAEQAYFHHELGVLALCSGNLERARAELEASIGLRGALADRRGAVAGRRALALVSDRMAEASGAIAAFAQGLTGEEAAAVAEAASATTRLTKSTPPAGVPALPPPPAEPEPYAMLGAEAVTGKLPSVDPDTVGTFVSPTTVPAADEGAPRGLAARGTRRNVAAAGAGALLAAVLGTVITLGYASDGDNPQGGTVPPDASTSQPDDGSLTVDQPTNATPGGSGGGSHAPTPSATSTSGAPNAPGPTPSPTATTSTDPTPTSGTTGGGTTDGGSSTGGTNGGSTGGSSGGSTSGDSTGGTTTSGGSSGGNTGGTDGGSGGSTSGGSSSSPTPSSSPSGTTDGGSSAGGSGTPTDGANGLAPDGSPAAVGG